MPTNGFCATNALATPLDSLATRLVANEANTISDLPRLKSQPAEYVVLFPAAPLDAKLTTAVWFATASRTSTCSNP